MQDTRTTKDRLRNAPYRLAARYGVPPFVSSVYWRVETAYWMARAAMAGDTVETTVAGETVRFGVSTVAEYRRATTLGGERDLVAALLSGLDGTETVWDVGACVGTYTCFVASALTTGQVVGFEPEAVNRSRLRANLETTAPAERWTVSPIALSDENGTTTLSSEVVDAGGGHHYLAPDGVGRTVETRRGADLLDDEFAPPDVVKIDVQGAELLVLRGLGDLLDTVESVYLEVHSAKCRRYGTSAEEVEAFLRAAGYSLTPLGGPADRRSGVYFVHAHR
ncbi:FkbM family methyltransferase [Halococcus hamelinensis]|uniref:Methyltransferase FkbM domain-containing protein n=1 Tax=Halococcus hamelinensis 100A6 TaxID=1132509 RepID=M0M125_9EURY|nr:FkbM family methyltransferase [Halococcus hamelinensis]EMA38070.1 hypothetical protein C447_11555 [Halococcus hamelinensis 100A6]